jgi:hypothetical protein
MPSRWNVAGRSWTSILCAIALASLLCACGRFGVALLPLLAAGPDAGQCDAASCEPAHCDGGLCQLACDDPKSSPSEGLCGCGRTGSAATGDSDADGVSDCFDLCPGAPDQSDTETCGCEAARADADSDGTSNCLDRCPFDGMKTAPGACGCGVLDSDDDRDNTPNCQDECPNDPDKTQPGSCDCGQSDADTDLDGTPDCMDSCSGRDEVTYTSNADCGTGYCRAHNTASTCLLGVEMACVPAQPLSADDSTCDGVDDDCDGRVDEDFATAATSCGRGVCSATGSTRCSAGKIADSCVAGQPSASDDATCNDRDEDCDGRVDEDVAVEPSTCAMGACAMTGTIACVGGVPVDSCVPSGPTTATDPTCNNIDDDCDGSADEEYVASATSCGVGACARTGMRTCQAGTAVDSCSAGSPTGADTTCNRVDEDCDGRFDEAYVSAATSCGVGACASTGNMTCVNGATQNSCVPKTRQTTVDDATSPGNNIDDDCDGKVDEDLPACDITPKTYEAGAHSVVVPGDCSNVSVRLWGGAGASGQTVSMAVGGTGGPGGYATATALVMGTINLYVGNGGSSGCNVGGVNAGSATYNGGSGGATEGANGGDGSASGGGTGAKPSPGYAGGNGHYGGGGGGESAGDTANSGDGGGGGAASVLIVNGVRVALAGGGGGGGGALSILSGLVSDAGGNGGSGCKGNGQVATSNGGGGGGGGACQGGSTQSGSGITPAFTGDLPSGRARGGSGSCVAGGAGYAILTFSP